MEQNREQKYEAVVGLETHVELLTRTKMFCGCLVSFGDDKNVHTCPVCLGHPGSLPVINRRAVEYALMIALALNCDIRSYTIFHRKNYFYPDLSKNYQISQYDLPLGVGGCLELDMGKYVRRVGITRVHMEEDTAKLIHTGATGRISEAGASIVDFNRAGTPLIEIVSEPDIRSPEEAKQYMVTLRNILLYLGVSDCSMEEGSLRCDANVSVRPADQREFGTKAEIKNLNSFKFLEKGLAYEIKRQTNMLKEGKKVLQQTRHYDNNTNSTKPLRTKEEAKDYRYFAEPDLEPIEIEKSLIEEVRKGIPELPREKAQRFKQDYGLSDYDASFLTNDAYIAQFFEDACAIFNDAKTVCNWIMGDFSAMVNKEGISFRESKLEPADLAEMLKMIETGKISSKIAKSVFEEIFKTGKKPGTVIKEKSLEQISDSSLLDKIVEEVLAENPGPVKQYKEGKKKAIGYLIGQVMAKTRGKANPRMVNEMIIKKINGG
ncbi:MAG: Asp-tRNA(Asn)/Glu-tRNA(Gln) amidotransferase subunit GatB [Actinomycetota bacterium]